MPIGRVGGAGLTRNGPTARGLRPEDLRWRCDPVALGFETTENVRPLDAFVGQERGVSAIDLAVRVTARSRSARLSVLYAERSASRSRAFMTRYPPFAR